jgi:hypothetical protein
MLSIWLTQPGSNADAGAEASWPLLAVGTGGVIQAFGSLLTIR